MVSRILIIIFLLVPYVSQAGPGADKYKWDCGPASVSMLIEHYTGLEVTPDSMMDWLGIGDIYTTAEHLKLLLNRYGLDSEVIKFKTLDKLIEYSEHDPIIVLLYAHWVVFYDGDDETVTYHDPLHGPHLVVDRDEFVFRGWGIVVTDIANSRLGILYYKFEQMETSYN